MRKFDSPVPENSNKYQPQSQEGKELFVDEMWNAVMEDSDFRPMIKAWDAVFFSATSDYEYLHIDLLQQLKRDMKRLDSALESKLKAVQASMSRSNPDALSSIELDADGGIISVSSSLFDTGISRSKLEHDTKELDLSKNQVHLIMSPTKAGARLLALLPYEQSDEFPKKFLVEQSDRSWQVRHEAFIKQLLGFTNAELEIAKLIYTGLESSQIADIRKRSVYTIRKQIKSILEKASVHSQRQLVQLLSSILMMVDRVEDSGSVQSRYSEQTLECDQLGYDSYGDPTGRLIFTVCPTIPPSYFSFWHQLLVKHHLKLVVVHKSQADAVSYRDHSSQYLESLSTLFRRLCGSLDDSIVLGFTSGGVYASELVQRHKNSVASLVFVDTGHPRTHIKDFLSLPADIRRTFLPAKYAHRLLLTPHKVVANDFFSSLEGERRVVEFFLKCQSHDLANVVADDSLYREVRDMLSYGLSDSNQLVFNMTHWVKDWSDSVKDLDGVAKLSVLGNSNTLFQKKRFEAWCKRHDFQSLVLNHEGRLMMFSLREKLLEMILLHLNVE